MRWSWRILRVGETEVRVHITLVLLLGYFAWAGWQGGGLPAALEELAFLVLLFLSVLLHEFGHIFAARAYRIPTPQILLTPIGGMARIARMPDKPREELVVALAGPAVTLLIIALLWAGLTATGTPVTLRSLQVVDLPLWLGLLYINIVLLLFNMLPSFPMDGGRVLRALLAMKLGLLRATRIAARVGQVLAIGFAVVALQGSPLLLLIAAFVFFGAEAEYEAVRRKELAGTMTAERFTVTDIRTLPTSARLEDAIQLLVHSDQRAFPVADGLGRLLGTLTRDDMLRGVARHGMGASVLDVMHPAGAGSVIVTGTAFEPALQQLMSSGREALPVVDAEGRLVGLMSRDNVTDVLLVQGLKAELEGRSSS